MAQKMRGEIPGEAHKHGLVFISYSHKDKKWLDELLLFLKPDVQRESINVWDDSKIEPGAQWSEEIESALAAAKVAVLLVSSHFLASDYITTKELPNLLDAAKERGLTILWIAISESPWGRTPIATYQSAHTPSKPLNSLSRASRDKAWNQICEKILASIRSSQSSESEWEKGASKAASSLLQRDAQHDIFDSILQDPGGVRALMKHDTTLVEPGQSVELEHQQILLAGYVYTEQNDQEFILVRGSARLPMMKIYTPGAATVEQAINETILAFFTELGITTARLVEVGFSLPTFQQLYRIDQTRQTIENRPCIFFKLSVNTMLYGSTPAWEHKRYRWAPKQEVVQLWRLDDFRYGQEDTNESHLDFIDDPYEALTKDWINLELGCTVLVCVDMLIFRATEQREIEFLLIQRRNNLGWEYPKGGLFYYETPLEGALREIDEETGIKTGALSFCGQLGWQIADVGARGKYYDTLRVHGLTFSYKGDPQSVHLDANHQAYAWRPLQEAVASLWIPYGPEFFRRWDMQKKEILRRAGFLTEQG